LAHFKENGKIPMECVYLSAYLDEEKKRKGKPAKISMLGWFL